MSHRRDIWHDALVEHLEEREWSQVQIINLTHRIGHSALMSCEGVLEVLEYQQLIDSNIEEKKREEALNDFERVFNKDQFQQTQQYKQATPLQYDSEGNYHNPDGWDVT